VATLPAILDVAADAGTVDISDAITGGSLERTINGASTLTIDVHDPHRDLIRAKDMQRAIDLKYDGVWFRLVKLSKSGTTVTLTFEDRDVAYLRRHTKPRKVARSKMTRAQFVRSLVREVKANRIKFYCPEVNERQPIGKTKAEQTPAKRDDATRDDNRQKGLAGDVTFKVQGTRADATQKKNAERVMDVADTLGAGPKAMKALVLACITESGMYNLNWGDRDSLGILQVRTSTSGSAKRSRDIEWCCREFLTKGFWGKGGAIEIAQKQPNLTAGQVAQQTQGSAFGSRYDYYSDEADAFIDAYGGASGSDTGGAAQTVTFRKKYEFSRGQAGEREDSWTAIQRLATEVNWRAFMDKGTLYFISEDKLLAARAKYTISEDTDGVLWIDFDIDQGKVNSEIRVQARTELFDIRVGTVMAIREMGIANGRWLVETVRRDLFEPTTEITLKAKTPKLPEPDTQTGSRTTGGQGDATGTLRQRIVATAKSTLTKTTRFERYSQSGALTDDPTPAAPARTDCSQWVRAVYLKAGAKDPGTYTGDMIAKGKRTDSPRPGDLLISQAHVELFVDGDTTYGHGSPPIDEGSVKYHRSRGLYFLTFDFLDD
jgi:hypothetical protein